MDMVTYILAKKYTDSQLASFKPTDISGIYIYKGSVASYADLPSTAEIGDVYNVENEYGQNYAWNGTEWDSLGGIFSAEVPVDGKSIESTETAIQIKGFTEAPLNAYLVKDINGEVAWVVNNSNEAVEEIKSLLGDIPEGQTLREYIDNLDQANVKGISIAGVPLTLEDGIITIPIASNDEFGLVKTSDEITIDENGSLVVSFINTDKLIQGEQILVLYGGQASE